MGTYPQGFADELAELGLRIDFLERSAACDQAIPKGQTLIQGLIHPNRNDQCAECQGKRPTERLCSFLGIFDDVEYIAEIDDICGSSSHVRTEVRIPSLRLQAILLQQSDVFTTSASVVKYGSIFTNETVSYRNSDVI